MQACIGEKQLSRRCTQPLPDQAERRFRMAALAETCAGTRLDRPLPCAWASAASILACRVLLARTVAHTSTPSPTTTNTTTTILTLFLHIYPRFLPPPIAHLRPPISPPPTLHPGVLPLLHRRHAHTHRKGATTASETHHHTRAFHTDAPDSSTSVSPASGHAIVQSETNSVVPTTRITRCRHSA